MRNVVDTRPFTLTEGDTHFVTFLKKAPSTGDASRLQDLSNDFDTLVVHGAEVHWRMHGRSTDSHLSRRDWEKVLGPLSRQSQHDHADQAGREARCRVAAAGPTKTPGVGTSFLGAVPRERAFL